MTIIEIKNNIESQLKDFIGNKYAVIGISGGIDSAVVACLCVNVLGKDRVIGALMPYGDEIMDDAEDLAKSLDIKTEYVDIMDNVSSTYSSLSYSRCLEFTGEYTRLLLGNIKARERMKILYAISNWNGGIVIGTGNKSEIEIGYFTKYGDGGVDVEPIGDLYKTEVYELAKILPQIPQSIINKSPSAGLWAGQTDEKELGMSYAEIDAVLKGKITSGKIYYKVRELRKNSEHKRHQAPVFSKSSLG